MNIWEIHPALVHFPLTLYLAATALDMAGVLQRKDHLIRASAFTLVAAVIGAAIAAVAGLVAYFTVPPHPEEAHVRIIIHALLAISTAVIYGIVLVLHSKPPSHASDRRRLAISVLGAFFLTATGALGGYLVYQDGIGVEKPPAVEMGNWKVHLKRLFGDEPTDD